MIDKDENNGSENNDSAADEALDRAELIEKTGEVTSQNAKHIIHCLTIIGQVEGHYLLPPQNKTTKYEHIMPALVAVEQDRSIEGLVIILNTVGGDVEAGLAIAELIAVVFVESPDEICSLHISECVLRAVHKRSYIDLAEFFVLVKIGKYLFDLLFECS